MAYRYYNVNPKHLNENDCVTRAITLATGLSYGTIRNLLKFTGELLGCDELCVCCYHYLLENIFRLKRYDAETATVKEIASRFPSQTIVIRIEGHLTCAVDGVIYDTWNCSDKVADCFWVVKEISYKNF